MAQAAPLLPKVMGCSPDTGPDGFREALGRSDTAITIREWLCFGCPVVSAETNIHGHAPFLCRLSAVASELLGFVKAAGLQLCERACSEIDYGPMRISGSLERISRKILPLPVTRESTREPSICMRA
jgi:hypothetical protein